MDAESCWLPFRLEWMSSIRPLRYLVVTFKEGMLVLRATVGGMNKTHRFVLLVEVVDVAV